MNKIAAEEKEAGGNEPAKRTPNDGQLKLKFKAVSSGEYVNFESCKQRPSGASIDKDSAKSSRHNTYNIDEKHSDTF